MTKKKALELARAIFEAFEIAHALYELARFISHYLPR
jgi:hypothetical protein